MKPARWWALTGSVGLVVSMAAVAGSTAASAHVTPPRLTLAGSLASAQERAHPDGGVAASSQVSFDLTLSLRNATGAQSFSRAVSTPGSAQFHHYLTDAQWVSRFGPTQAEVTKAEAWLRQEGFTVGSVAKDRLFVSAQASAQRVEHAFGAKLGYYKVNGERVRLAEGTLSVPSSMAGVVAGTVGVNEYLATSALGQVSQAAAHATANSAKEPAPPAGFRNPPLCSSYWGQKTDTTDSAKLYAPYKGPLPYDICGYKPAQLRGAYGLASSVAKGDDGKGETIAIVDAYDSPTLLSDAQEYFQLNDPSHPLMSSQFSDDSSSKVTNVASCGGGGWYPEQALDVESSHSMAPGANIEFVGATSCEDNDLLAADTTAITSGAQVVSNSWDDVTGDVFTDPATKNAYDNTFLLANATGVSVLFCSHDYGDNFASFGTTAQNYPATSPYVTAVGGTALEINAKDQRTAEYGWSTSKQVMCDSSTTNCGTATKPAGTLFYDDGGAGGTSYYYTEPYYQDGVVPSDLTLRNEALNGSVPYRVVPDISMDADPQTGMLIGLTEVFPNGTYYAQYKEGGTSLASPLLAGVVADADQAAGGSLGFLNPLLYKASTATPAAFDDILTPASPWSTATVRVDYVDGVNAFHGYVMSVRGIQYEGDETYCDGTGNCATRDVSLNTTPGFDSMTGIGSVGTKFIATMKKF
ncbi:MAG TPA: S53 family peptidase [Streptosporangiaceae bacterium]|jgi:subtilase family serine protease